MFKVWKAKINWYKLKQGGIGLPRIRLSDNTIFPVCFVSDKGIPVSQTLCIRIRKSCGLFWKRAKITLISDDLWKANKEGKSPWELADKFVIYNYGEVIGEGKISN